MVAHNRWDATGLGGHSKAIFDALDNLVKETAEKYRRHQGTDITTYLQQIVSGYTRSHFGFLKN